MSNGSEQGGGGKYPTTLGNIFDEQPEQGGGPTKNPFVLGGGKPAARTDGPPTGPKNPGTLSGDDPPEQGGGGTKNPGDRGVKLPARTDGPKNPGTLGGTKRTDPPEQRGGGKAPGTLGDG